MSTELQNTAEPVGLSTAQMKDVLEISRLLAITANLESLLERVAISTCSLLRCDGTSIWLHDAVADELFTTVVIKSGPLRVPVRSGIVGAAFTTNCIVAVDDAYADPRFNPSSDQATGFVTRSLMATPLVNIDGKPIGVIEAVNKTSGTFTLQDRSLVQLFADQVGVAIQRHRLQVTARHAAELHREISIAREVQQGLLPKVLPTLVGFDLFGWAKSASIAGGDCYDLWTLEDGRLGIFLADASGHGLGAALVVSQIRTLVRALCDGTSPSCMPHDVIKRVHKRLSADLDISQFVTVFLGFLAEDGTLNWQSAGQGPILYRPGAGESIQALLPILPPINSSIDLPNIQPAAMSIKPGGMLAVLSDGIFESFDEKNQLLGVERVIESMDKMEGHSAAAVVEQLHTVVECWQGHDQPRDDQTIVMINGLKTAENSAPADV